jgi:hypothetical protein
MPTWPHMLTGAPLSPQWVVFFPSRLAAMGRKQSVVTGRDRPRADCGQATADVSTLDGLVTAQR